MSEAVVEVYVVSSITGSVLAINEMCIFTVENRTAPRGLAMQAIHRRTVGVGFDRS